MNAGEPKGNQFHEMKQSHRDDPYSLAPSEGNRPLKSQVGGKSPREEAGKYDRSTQHNEFGSTREI
ncbi:MAG: hypothetical protein ACYC9R_13255 [Nitrosotalea sp.]